jgi:alcohol dehydrogenase (cytochrome c)
MHTTTRLGAAAVLAVGSLGYCLTATAAPVTEQRLLGAASEGHNWLTIHNGYSNHMHSRLSQINRDTVGGLGVAFAVALGGTDQGAAAIAPGQQATPLVNDGFLYVNNGWNQVRKIDVRSGRRGTVVWFADPLTDKAAAPLPASRGIALLGSNVYTSTLDARLVAFDDESGEIVFDVGTSSPDDFQNQSHTGAPLALKNQIMVSQSNGFRGNRGWVGAFNAADGSLMWRTFTVPGPGDDGHETWADNHDAWRTGGAAVWTTGAYDPQTELYIHGTGDPAPWGDPEFRPGDNLYSVSTVALDVNTGERAWFFQEIPNESWDYDSVNPRLLYSVEVDGQMRNVTGNFSRGGHYYTLDRDDGAFLSAVQYVPEVNWTQGIDPKTGKPLEYNPDVVLQDYAGIATRRDGITNRVCPDFNGQPTYFPGTFDPGRRIAYIASAVGCKNMTLNTPNDEAKDYRGENMGGGWQTTKTERQNGHITGVSVDMNEVVVTVNTAYPINSGLMSTAGDLVFTAQIDGTVSASDSDTLAELWSFNAGTPIVAPPITYSAEGRQYIAVVAGGPSLLFGGGGNIPEMARITPSSMLFVFGL